MIQIRRAEERGANRLDWLDTKFTFSFDRYFDPQYMGFRQLRVINEDVIAPGKGFGMHPHRDMEILTWVLEGALTHRDNMGNTGTTRPGEIQHMSAGTGVVHSEWNASPDKPVHLLQIWIHPERSGLKPEYEQLRFSSEELSGGFALLAGPEAPVTIHQDAKLYAARLQPGRTASLDLLAGRFGWLQVARGEVFLNGQTLGVGDGAALSNEMQVTCNATRDSEILLFDLA